MFKAHLPNEIGEAGLLAICEGARTGEMSPVLYVVIRNLSIPAKRALQERAAQIAPKRPAPRSIRDDWQAAA